MSVYFDRKRKRWTFDFSRTIDGRRIRSTKLLPQGWSKTKADRYDQTQGARYFAEASGIEKPRLLIAGAVKLYLDHRIPQLRNGTKAAQDLAHLVPMIDGKSLQDLKQLSTDYEIKHRGSLAPGTIHNRLAYLRAAVGYAYRHHDYGDMNYGEKMILPDPDNERQVYAKLPELDRLWRAFDEPEAAAMFKAAFFMGLRWRSELLSRTPDDIVKNGRETWLVIGHTKNGKPIMKPVHHGALECLKFIPWSWSDSWYYARWWAAVAKIGRPEMVPHDLRHSVASEILSRGHTLSEVQGALGHVSIQSTQRYAHLYPSRLRDVMLGVGGPKFTRQQRRTTAGKK